MKMHFSELRSEMSAWPSGQKMIFCSVFLSIAGGRWASYIGIPSINIYLVDILFFGGWILSFNRFFRLNSYHSILYHSFLLTFIVAQFIRDGEYSAVTRLRDELPYIYFLTLPIIAFLFKSTSTKIIVLLVRLASFVHICWLIPLIFHILQPITLGGIFGIPIFSDRWDQSGIAIAIGILAWKPYPENSLKGNSVIQLVLITCGLFQWSRASLIAVSVATLLSLMKSKFRAMDAQQIRTRLPFFLVVSAMLFSLTLQFLSSYIPANSVLNRLGVTNISESLQSGASETVDARKVSQQLLYDWVKERQQIILGVGPGTEMVQESGAYILLSGDPNVRSPHSWLYGGICRFGVVGFLYWLFLLSTGFRKNFSFGRIVNAPFSFAIPILIVSLFGVIVESPFGSLPLVFFTAVASVKSFATHKEVK